MVKNTQVPNPLPKDQLLILDKIHNSNIVGPCSIPTNDVKQLLKTAKEIKIKIVKK